MKILLRHMTGIASLTSMILVSQSAFSQNIPIVNYSFEDPAQGVGNYNNDSIPGWNVSGVDEGVWNPGGDMGTPPDGVQVGYINYGSVSQTLGSDLMANTTYTLQIYVGGREDGLNPGTDYSIGLYGGANLLASVTPVTPPTGSFTALKATFTTGSSVPGGEALGITISTPAIQLDFDDVTLNASPSSSVPDAGNVTYIAMFGLMAFSRFVRARK